MGSCGTPWPFSYDSGSVLAVDSIVFAVKVLGSGTFSPGCKCMGFPIPAVAGKGAIPNAFSGSSAFFFNEESLRAVEDMVLSVSVLGSGTRSPD